LAGGFLTEGGGSEAEELSIFSLRRLVLRSFDSLSSLSDFAGPPALSASACLLQLANYRVACFAYNNLHLDNAFLRVCIIELFVS
jgi:hypothetical protein